MNGLLKFYKFENSLEYVNNKYYSPEHTMLNFVGKYLHSFFFNCEPFSTGVVIVQEIDKEKLSKKEIQINSQFSSSVTLSYGNGSCFATKFSEPQLDYNKIYRLKISLAGAGLFYSDLFCVSEINLSNVGFLDNEENTFVDENNDLIIE